VGGVLAAAVPEHVRHDVQLLLYVIEDHHVVEEQQLRVGRVELVRMRVRDLLGPSADAVAKPADRSAEKRRELVFAFDAKRHQFVVEELHRVGDSRVEAQAAPRLEADEGVAAEVLASLDAFEEEGFLAICRKRGEGHQWSERVGAELAHDGDDVVVHSKTRMKS
jgi:hypothetical protein